MICFVSELEVRLEDLKPGTLFTDEDRTYFAIKTQYRTNGVPDCYLLGSGEAVDLVEKDKNLLVYPALIENVTQ